MRHRDLRGWLLMAVLFILAIAVIFYILLMRAQHFARLEEQRVQNNSGSQVESLAAAHRPLVVVPSPTPDGEPMYAYVTYAAAAGTADG